MEDTLVVDALKISLGFFLDDKHYHITLDADAELGPFFHPFAPVKHLYEHFNFFEAAAIVDNELISALNRK